MKIEKASKYKEGATGYVVHLSKEELVYTMALIGWVSKMNHNKVYHSLADWWTKGWKAMGLSASSMVISDPFKDHPVLKPDWEPKWDKLTGDTNGNS